MEACEIMWLKEDKCICFEEVVNVGLGARSLSVDARPGSLPSLPPAGCGGPIWEMVSIVFVDMYIVFF